MNILSIVYLLAFLIYLWLIGFLLYKNHKSSLNRVCALVIFSFCIWSFCSIFLHSSLLEDSAFLWTKISSLGWASFPALSLWFFLVFTKRERVLRHKIIYPFLFLVPLFFIYLQWKGLLVGAIKVPYGWATFWPKSIWPYLYLIYCFSFLFIGLYLCFDFRKRTDKIIEKKQATIISSFTIIALILGSTVDMFLPILEIYVIPSLSGNIGLIWILGLIIAITKYGLITITPQAAAEDILSTMTESLILINPDREIAKVNRATLALLKYRESQLIGKSINTILADEALFRGEQFERLLREGRIKDYDTEYMTQDGACIPVSLSCSVIYNRAQDMIGIVGIAKDLRQTKELIRQLKKERTELDRLVRERTQELETSQQELEKKLQELEKYRDSAIERELYMIKLEKEIDSLLEELGESKKYYK